MVKNELDFNLFFLTDLFHSWFLFERYVHISGLETMIKIIRIWTLFKVENRPFYSTLLVGLRLKDPSLNVGSLKLVSVSRKDW